MKRVYWLPIAIVLMALAPALQAAEPLKIGFVDADRINRESAPAEQASKRLEKEFAPRVAALQRMDKQIKDMQSKLEKDSMTISDSDRLKREETLARMSRDFQRKQREYREDLNMRRNEELTALFEKANKVIKQIAQQQHFDLILQEAVYRSPRIDITDQVLKALAAETKKK